MKLTRSQLKEMVREEIWKLKKIDESGILYKAGVKKYGKAGMKKIQQAAGKRKSHAEIGKIKDKYEKDKKESVNEIETLGASGLKSFAKKHKYLVRSKKSGGRVPLIYLSKDGKQFGPFDPTILTKKYLLKKLGLSESVNEAEVDGSVFVKKWNKAMSLAKSTANMWSPHLRKSSKSASIGYTNSDFWGKVPDKWNDASVFGFHKQSASRAFREGYWEDDLGLTWQGNGRDIVKVLKRAGFKAKWDFSEQSKIILTPG
tara:strand:+ start:4579 stop:5352 length:774 start_codon:yes stop_codon:yes gene_type:complete